MKRFHEIKDRAALAWRILRSRDGGLLKHAHRELADWRSSDDEMSRWMAHDLTEILRTFSSQGHSGFSASYAISCFKTLARYEPLGPLTGEESEWNDIGERDGTTLYQNNRCSRVFKEDGVAYDIDGVVFEEPNGCRFTGRHSRVTVQFPYTPRTVVARVAGDATDEQKATAAALALAVSPA